MPCLQWRLRRLWTHLHELGFQEHEMSMVWSQVEDVVIKSILCGHSSMLKDFRAKAGAKSSYNAYKLLGYDLMLDKDLKYWDTRHPKHLHLP